MTSTRYSFTWALLTVLVLTGCRTYGQYGSTDTTVAKISQTTEAFARAHERAEADLESFRRAAASRPQLEPYVVRYGEIVGKHGELVDEHMQAIEKLGGGLFAYSAANRLLGAFVSEQNIIAREYSEVVTGAAVAMGMEVGNQPRPPGNYEHVPPFYERLRYAIVTPSLDAVLRAAG